MAIFLPILIGYFAFGYFEEKLLLVSIFFVIFGRPINHWLLNQTEIHDVIEDLKKDFNVN
jgi:hypothetical protein